MNGNQEFSTVCDNRYSLEDIRHVITPATLVRLTCAGKGIGGAEEQTTVCYPHLKPLPLDVTARQPFRFAFTAGVVASFNVPSAYCFVIHQVHMSSSGESPCVSVQLVTRSPHMTRTLTLPCEMQRDSASGSFSDSLAAPILVHGLTANTFVFSNGALHHTSTVPADTYLQVRGYLERTHSQDAF